jgi:hypothetical protein
MAIATSQEQLEHVANAVMHGIHDVFPADETDSDDPISFKKLLKKEGQWALGTQKGLPRLHFRWSSKDHAT